MKEAECHYKAFGFYYEKFVEHKNRQRRCLLKGKRKLVTRMLNLVSTITGHISSKLESDVYSGKSKHGADTYPD